MMASAFPEVQSGGSLILAWQVKNKKVLVVGGGEVGISHRITTVQMQDVDIDLKGT